MRLLSPMEYWSFVLAKPAAVVHFDADWNVSRQITRLKVVEASLFFSDRVNFGEIDVDRDAEIARSIPVVNVPLVAYYMNGSLVAGLIGAAQNVRARLELMLAGKPIGYHDCTT